MDHWADDLVEKIADRVWQRIAERDSFESRLFADRLTFNEQEAAAMLGVPKHVLKGCRERGEISPPKIGKQYRYSRELLLEISKGK
ncbi:MAG: helix-turn-helix domain-containing protein [bacterium]|nr:helix-turn-helix domain-containing protein [bacterium]